MIMLCNASNFYILIKKLLQTNKNAIELYMPQKINLPELFCLQIPAVPY